jgi:tellurite resistance protein TehA-like permease
LAWLKRGVAGLYPGYFALVMATGIISNAFFFMDWLGLSDGLFAVNVVAYPVLLLMTLARAIAYPLALWRDLTDPKLVFSFFTIVAASDVFGVQCDLRGMAATASALWLFAFLVWFMLLYFSFSVLTFLNTAHNANVVHGGWLIAIVGTQSLVLLGARVAEHTQDLAGWIFILIHMLWGIGIGLYGIFVTLFSYRIFFFEVEPKDVTPLHWVVMGAAAISANAGTTLILSESHLSFLHAMQPFVDGVTLIIWAWGTWWIPLLIVFGIWAHGIRKMPLVYTPALWSMVFPLGMYSLSTFRLSLATQFPPLQNLGLALVWVAFAVWLVIFAAMLTSLWRTRHVTRAQNAHAPPS